jgi:hypothetical protein
MVSSFTKSIVATAIVTGSLGLVSASAAQAGQFTAPGAGGGTTTITSLTDGTPKNSHHVFDVVLAFNVLPITCNEADFHGSMSGESATTITVTANYAGCTFLGQAGAIEMNGCDFTFIASGGATIDCPGGKEITFSAANCTVHVPGGQVLSGVTYTNLGLEITANPKVANIHALATGAGCPATGTTVQAEYTTGNVNLRGERGGGVVNLDWDS